MYSGKVVEMGLCDSSIRLVRTGLAYALVLVVDPRRGSERLFQTQRAVKRGRTPVTIDLAYPARGWESIALVKLPVR